MELLCLFRRCGSNKAGPALTACVAVKRKLRDNQRASSYIQERPIHFSLIVFKDPQVCDLFGHADSDGGRVVAADPDQNHEASRDFSRDAALHGYTCVAYTLDNGSHLSATKFSPANWQDANPLCVVPAGPLLLPTRDSSFDPNLFFRLLHRPQRCGLPLVGDVRL